MQPDFMNFYKVLAIVLVTGAIAFAVLFVVLSATRELTTLELVVFQVMVLLLSLLGSFAFSREFAAGAADQSLRRHAKSAFRRVLSLFRGLSRIAEVADQPGEDVNLALAVIKATVKEHIDTADDALEDWREIVPEEADALRRSISPLDGGVNA